MKTSPVNIFQRLMRSWEAVHPYNAAQVLEIIGDFESRATFERWSLAWHRAIIAAGLGNLDAVANRYRFAAAVPAENATHIEHVAIPWPIYINLALDCPFEEADFPLRPFLARAGSGTIVVGVVYRHWIADSVSIRMLLREWFFHAVDPSKCRTSPLTLPTTGYWNSVGPGRRDFGIGETIAHAIRRQTRLRRAQKVSSQNLSDHRTQFRQVDASPGLLPNLKRFARDRGVGLNDLLLAGLAEACWRHVPLQPRPSRREVAVGSIVDLRPVSANDLSNVFGLYLGFTNVVCRPHELATFDRLLSVVSTQTRNQKSHGIAACSLMWMTAAAVIGRWSKPKDLYHFYRKDLPLAGGSSNVDLSKTWAADYLPDPLVRYVRVSPTGPMTPLVVTTTTLGDRLDIGLTHRVGLIDSARAELIGSAFVCRLETLANAARA